MAWSRKDWLILFALTGVAIFFRFFQLKSLPPGFQFDEAFNAIDAQLVLAGSRPLFSLPMPDAKFSTPIGKPC